MSLNVNQFAMQTVQGAPDLQFHGSVISAQVDAAQATALVPGQAVKLATTAGGLPKVIGLAANTDASFGFVLRNFKDASFAAKSNLEIALINSVMWMTAGAAITRGAKLEVVYTTNKVISNAGTNPVIGFALDTAAADGDLIRVYIVTQSYQSAQVIADIAGLQAALDALGESAVSQAITALTTVGAGTITAAGIVAGTTNRGGTQTAVFTDTTDTAANIVALLPTLSVGESFFHTYENPTTYDATLAGGSGVTVSGQTVVPANSWARYLYTYTGTNTFTAVRVAGGLLRNGGARACTAQVDRTSSTTLTAVTGCALKLAIGKYLVRAHISGTATANGGAKAALAGDGTLAVASISYTGQNSNAGTVNARTTSTTLGSAVAAATAVLTDIDIEGVIDVTVAGILSLQIAQNASHADTTSAYVNSFLEATPIGN
jgi:hypothetical protein